MLLGVTLFPVAVLGVLLWLTHLEETLSRDVAAQLRAAVPPPIVAIDDEKPDGVDQVVVPAASQAGHVPARVPAVGWRQAFWDSTNVSLGGSTKR